jgi:type II restriction enzyme
LVGICGEKKEPSDWKKLNYPQESLKMARVLFMNLSFDTRLADKYTSLSQKIRVLTESWVGSESYCPSCGSELKEFPNGHPVGDFFCQNCKEEYELKSKKDKMGNRILDGAYGTMIERLESANNPNFFFLNYNVSNYEILNFVVIPKHFFTPEIIVKRNQGIPNRPNYIMCSINLSLVPQSGKIFYIKDRKIESKNKVLENWQKTLFLREEKEALAKGWILDTMNCIDKLVKKEFSLDEIYTFEKELKIKHPDNNFIKDKIRQQLQLLRDRGYLKFIGRGRYEIR